MTITKASVEACFKEVEREGEDVVALVASSGNIVKLISEAVGKDVFDYIFGA